MSIATTWGTTPSERTRPYPCDGLIVGADAYFRGVTVDAPADVVFRWLCQLRAAPYSYDWIDNLGRRSPQQLTPGLDDLRVGQRVMRIFDLTSFERDRQITAMLRAGRPSALFGQLAASYVIDDCSSTEGGGSGGRVGPRGRQVRLIAKLAVRHSRAPWGWITRVLLPWGDLVMMRNQLLNLKRLAERDARARAAERAGQTQPDPSLQRE